MAGNPEQPEIGDQHQFGADKGTHQSVFVENGAEFNPGQGGGGGPGKLADHRGQHNDQAKEPSRMGQHPEKTFLGDGDESLQGIAETGEQNNGGYQHVQQIKDHMQDFFHGPRIATLSTITGLRVTRYQEVSLQSLTRKHILNIMPKFPVKNAGRLTAAFYLRLRKSRGQK